MMNKKSSFSLKKKSLIGNESSSSEDEIGVVDAVREEEANETTA